MKITATPLENAYIIEPEPFQDRRGQFARIFCKRELKEIGLTKDIAQINHSITIQKGAVRGMHFQYPPKAEIKIVKCLRGSVFDVIVDLRKRSPTFLKWHGETLSAENMKMMYAPEGFAHGFQSLEENCELLYLHTEFYCPAYEGGLHVNDPSLGIVWPIEMRDISERDRTHPFIGPDFEGIVLAGSS